MSGVSAIQAVNPAETWQAWLQAATEAAQATAEHAAAAEMPSVAAPAAVQTPSATQAADAPMATLQPVEANTALLPMAPVLMQPLTLQNGPELRWRVQDAPAWRRLFDEAGGEAADAFHRLRRVQRHLDDGEARLHQRLADGQHLLRRDAAQDGDERQAVEIGLERHQTVSSDIPAASPAWMAMSQRPAVAAFSISRTSETPSRASASR